MFALHSNRGRGSGSGGASIGGAVTNGTAGSLLFVNPDAILAQNNQNLYYDNTLSRFSAYGSLGTELLSNPNFTGSATGWTVGSGYAYSSNTVVHSSNGTAALSQSVSGLTLYREHLCTFVISAWTVGTVTVSCGGITGTAVGANGTYTFRFVPTNTNALSFTPTNTARFTIDTVSVKVLTGGEIRTGYMNLDGSWSNSQPGTSRAQSFNNAGSNTWTDYNFSGVLRVSTGANSSGGYDTYTSGSNGAAYYNGNAGLTSNSLYSFNYSGYFYHGGDLRIVGHGMFGGKVGAGTGASTTPTSTLMTAGGLSLKPKRVTTNTTLDDTAYFWIVDASTPSCNGTPSVTTCSSYTGSGQSVCESHLPCAWFAGYSCSAFNNEYGMGTCSGTSGCSADSNSCSGAGDESTCTNQNSGYGGSCAWSGNDCSGFDESQCGSYSGSGCTVNTSDCSSFNGNESGCSGQSGCSVSSSNTCPSQGDESSCTGAGCTWDGMSCTGDNSTCSGSYFTGCSGTYYSCTGTYYNGTCSGTYGAACSGTATCSGYSSSGACTGEAGCSWVTAATITLPDSAVLPNYSCSIYNGSYSGADVNIVAPSGHTTDVSILAAYKDSVILQGFNDVRQCSEFSSAGACTPTGCTANYSNCSWNSGDNTCSGNVACDGIGDQGTCEATTYFSSCSGTWYASKHYYRLAS